MPVATLTKPVQKTITPKTAAECYHILDHLHKLGMNQPRFLRRVVSFNDYLDSPIFSSKLVVYTYGRARYGNERFFKVEQYMTRSGQTIGWWAVPDNRTKKDPTIQTEQ